MKEPSLHAVVCSAGRGQPESPQGPRDPNGAPESVHIPDSDIQDRANVRSYSCENRRVVY